MLFRSSMKTEKPSQEIIEHLFPDQPTPTKTCLTGILFSLLSPYKEKKQTLSHFVNNPLFSPVEFNNIKGLMTEIHQLNQSIQDLLQ